MRALARIAVADGGPTRGTRLTALRGDPPLLPRRTHGSGSDGELELHLVGGAAGPLGGDDLRIEIEVGPDARLCLRSVAASLALPGPAGSRSRLSVTARVAAGGQLRWLPEPLIGAAGCDHHTITEIELTEGATLVWRDELVCGRHAEPVGDVRLETTVRYGGRTVFRNNLAVGPRTSGWSGAAVLGGARAVGSVLLVDPTNAGKAGTVPPTSPPYDSTDWVGAALPLAGWPAVLVSAVGSDLRSVRACLERLSAGSPTGQVTPEQIPA